MLSETGENRGRTLKLGSEKEENQGTTLILGCGKQEKFCPFLKQKGRRKQKIPTTPKQMYGKEENRGRTVI